MEPEFVKCRCCQCWEYTSRECRRKSPVGIWTDPNGCTVRVWPVTDSDDGCWDGVAKKQEPVIEISDVDEYGKAVKAFVKQCKEAYHKQRVADKQKKVNYLALLKTIHESIGKSLR